MLFCQLLVYFKPLISFTLQATDYSFLLSAIHFPAHPATCIIRWLTHIILELRRCLPDSVTIFQLPKS